VKPIRVSGEGEHGVRPYNICMVANDSYQVVIESSGFLLSIRGQRVTKNQVVLLVVYPKDTASFKDDLISSLLSAGSWSRNSMFALPSRLVSPDIRTRVFP
jgi:hypothetical protein